MERDKSLTDIEALEYMDPESSITLREALAEYYRSNPSLLDPTGMPDEAGVLFRQHDAGHVFFGCDTSLRGEVLIDCWTIFGTSIGLRGYLKYLRQPQVNQVFAETGYFRVAMASVRCIPDVVRVAVRSRKMSQPWPWRDYEDFLDRRLCDMRAEYGVRVLR